MKNDIKTLKILIIVSIVIFIGILRFSQGIDDFSTYNAEWNGGKDIRNELSKNHTVSSMPGIDGLTVYDPDKTAFIILGPDEIFSKQDRKIVKEFIENGGLLILADDFGTGNYLLDNLTTGIAFSNMLILDDVNYRENITFPVTTTNIANVSEITMNYPTSLIIENGSVNILASTSLFSWLSKDGVTRERSGSFPVIADISYGQGKIVAIADPSIFINSMLPFGDNNILFEKLVGNRTDVIFYEKNRTPPVAFFHYLLKTNPYVQYLFAAIVISLTLLYMKRDQLSGTGKDKTNVLDDELELDEDYIISDISKRQKWDERKVKLFRTRLKGKNK